MSADARPEVDPVAACNRITLYAKRQAVVLALSNGVATAAARDPLNAPAIIERALGLLRDDAKPRDPEAWAELEAVVRRLSLAIVEGRAPRGTNRQRGEGWPRVMAAIDVVYGAGRGGA